MEELNRIKVVLSTITLLILGFIVHIGVLQNSKDHEIELIIQSVADIHSEQINNNSLNKSLIHTEWGVSFTEFNPTTGTVQNTIFSEGKFYSSTGSIDSENILLGQKTTVE